MNKEETTVVQEFTTQNLSLMANYKLLTQPIKDAQAKLDGFKSELLEAMQNHDIKSIDNEFMKVTTVAASESTSIDMKAFEKAEPVEYAQLKEDYPKVTKRKASLRITVK